MEGQAGLKKRYFVLATLFFAWIMSYLDRMVIAIAIPFIAIEWGLAPIAMGVIMSAFYGGYFISQIPGGILGDKYGSRRIMGWALVWWSIFTFLTGVVNGLITMIIVRVLFGLGEGLFPPASYKSVASWFPEKERGRAQAFMLTASAIGPAIASLFVAGIMSIWGWRTVFLTLSLPGLVSAYLVWRYVLDNPVQYKGISQKELDEINAEQPSARSDSTLPAVNLTFWQTLFTDAVWKTTIILCASNSALWGFGAWLPTYLMRVKGMSIAQMGFEAALPFIAGAFGLVAGGWISDKIFYDSRKMPIIIGEVAAALCLFLMLTVNDTTLLTICRMAAGFFLFWSLGSIMPLPVTIVPRAAVGRASGIILCGGFFGTLLTPAIMGYILEISGNNYTTAFAFVACCALIAAAAATLLKKRTAIMNHSEQLSA